jgi:hypothetical protein
MLFPAALYPASTRLLVALILGGLFGVIAPKRSPRPLALAVIAVIVVGWLFGATLIWGTAGPSKLRWGTELNAWQGAALLALAAAGVLSAGGALRYFAQQNRRAGWTLAAVFAVAFAGWSAVVRYAAIVALLVLAIGMAALWFASRPAILTRASLGERTSKTSSKSRPGQWIWNSAATALPFLSGFLFYWWLKISPKIWSDPACGLQGWLPWTFIPFIAIPASTAWSRTRTLGKSREAATAAVVVTTAITMGVGILTFLVWFGMNRCGE